MVHESDDETTSRWDPRSAPAGAPTWRAQERAASDSTRVRRRASTSASPDRHFLVPAMGAPIRLDVRLDPYVIGRDPGADVVVGSLKVSRRHCQIAFKGSPPRPFLADLGTRNGTFLNGAALSAEVALEDGDTLSLSDVPATYRRLAPGEDEAALQPRPSGRTTTVPLKRPASVAGGLSGELALYPATQLLLNLTQARASGRLVVEVGATQLALEFRHGNAADEGAFGRIAALKAGKFRFEPSDAAGPRP